MAINNVHPDPGEDTRGSYKRGYPVVCQPDGQVWGDQEQWPKFVYLKVPGVSCDRIKKYIEPYLDIDNPDPKGRFPLKMRRLWKIRFDDLPQAAKDKILNNHQLIIKVSPYSGTYDYTWSQIKSYFRNQYTGLDETVDP